jgi:rRNA maturation protein Rpf1
MPGTFNIILHIPIYLVFITTSLSRSFIISQYITTKKMGAHKIKAPESMPLNICTLLV